MERALIPRLLLIAGTGRGSGKTSLACRIIEKFAPERPVVAFKISPHRHQSFTGGRVIMDEEKLYIEEETDPDTGKDSSRMLAAGARKSFFLMADDEELPRAIRVIQHLSGEEAFLIGESGGLRKYVKPGLFILVQHGDERQRKPESLRFVEMADLRLSAESNTFDSVPDAVGIAEKGWNMKP